MAFPPFELSGKVALVTGGSSGIGRGLARALADAGADVAVTSRSVERAEPAAAEIEARGRRSLPLALEITDVAEGRAAVDAVVDAFGRIDILVNNAGINRPEPAAEVSRENWFTVLDTNLKGLFFLSQAAGRAMIDRGEGGRIINIGSQMGVVGGALRAAYCASKGGVTQLTKTLALEWAPYQITVNTIAPTFVRTPLTAPMFEDQAFLSDVLARIPLGRIAEVDDITGAVIFLASPAASMITGTTMLIDGGWTAR